MALKFMAMCKSGRLDAIIQAAARSKHKPEVYALSDVNNPRLVPTGRLRVGKTDDKVFVQRCIDEIKPDIVFIGPEEPLAAGIADLLRDEGIACVGPTRELARLETSKSFTRDLMKRYRIPGLVEHQAFTRMEGVRDYLAALTDFVVKPDGLTGGKGVKISGEHLHSVDEGARYCEELLDGQKAVVIEEKLDGEEFSFQSFFDGHNIAHTLPIQDHKRVDEGDRGANTGGMGSYSCADHLLPFLTHADVRCAAEINKAVGDALLKDTGEEYKGILYGGFMVTRSGIKVIEYNARFGDPEIMNALPLMQTDFIDLCDAIVGGRLNYLDVKFASRASVCKYVVPDAYPGKTFKSPEIDVRALDEMASEEPDLRVFYGALEQGQHGLSLTGSRAVGLVGLGSSLAEAERIAERAAMLVKGPVKHRRDIGTTALVQKRIAHMASVRRLPANELARAAG